MGGLFGGDPAMLLPRVLDPFYDDGVGRQLCRFCHRQVGEGRAGNSRAALFQYLVGDELRSMHSCCAAAMNSAPRRGKLGGYALGYYDALGAREAHAHPARPMRSRNAT